MMQPWAQLQNFRRSLFAHPEAHVRRGARRCYFAAATLRQKRIPFAELLYIEDREFFWGNRMLVTVAAMRLLKACGLAVDSRFADRRPVPGVIRRPAARLYRPSTPGIAPVMVNALISELMTVRQ
jgi:hypothetical protein